MSLTKLRGRALNEAVWGYILIAPTMILLGIFSYLSLIGSLGLSFTNWEVISPPQWVGLKNYIDLLQDKIFLQSVWNTVRFVLMSLPIGQALSLILALVLNSKIPFRNFFRLVFFLPVLTMPIAIAVVWKWIYNPAFGPFAMLFKSLGLKPIIWITSVNNAMWSIVLISVWLGVGYHMIIMLAGLQNIPREYYEAAQVDGANWWHQLFRITLPLLTPTLFFTMVTSFIGGLQMFDMAFILTLGGPMNTTRTIVYHIYEEGVRGFRIGPSAAGAWILFVMIMIITIIQLRTQKRWVHYE
jgi:multiple sugar transport system permease protein